MAVLNRLDVIAGYTVQNLIKSNLYTETYRIEDNNSAPYFMKIFLMKQMPSKLVNGETGMVREIEYALQINHRNIVSHVAHGQFEREDGSYQYYITNYFNGQILADKIAQEGKLTEAVALDIFTGILNGLNYLHQLNPALCHNDLDTSNTLLPDTNTSEPIIIDLGHLAPRSFGFVDFDTTDINPMFHANETLVNIFDEQGDIFSACVILYTMLTGHLPWEMDIPKEGSYKERFAELAQYRKTNKLDLSTLQVSDKTKYILQCGLQIKNQDRINTIQAILDILNSSGNAQPQQDNGNTYTNTSNSAPTSSDDPNAVNFEIKRGGGNGFKDIAGMQALKDYLYKQVIFVIKDPDLAKEYRLTPPNGMLLYGPPGCGKTFFAEKFAEETQFNFILIKASDLGSSYVHGSQDKISKLFKIAEQNSPIVICFDEFDALVPDRSTFGIQSQAGEVNEFLSQMNNCAKRGIFIVATSNRPDKIDPAVLRTGRIDKNVYVPLPDFEARKEMFSLYLQNRPITDNIDIDKLAAATEGYIASDIAFIVNDAAMTAAYTREHITHELLELSLTNTKPSLRKETLDAYNQIQEKMEDKNRSNNIRVVVNGL